MDSIINKAQFVNPNGVLCQIHEVRGRQIYTDIGVEPVGMVIITDTEERIINPRLVIRK